MTVYNAGSTRRSLIDTVAFRAVSQLATILSYIAFVRGMAKEDFGVYSLLYSFIPVLGTVASFGLEQVLRRYQPEYLSTGNLAGALWLVRFVASARFCSNVVLIGLLILTWNYVTPVFHLAPYRIQFAYFSLLLLIHFQLQILQLSVASHMLHRYSVGSVAVLSVGKLIGYALMLWMGAFTLSRAIFADTVAYALAYLFLRGIYRTHCLSRAPEPHYRPGIAERSRMLRYGLLNNFNDAGTLLLGGTVSNFFIAAFIDPISVGIYAFYGRLNEMAINILPVRLFDNVIQPLFFSIKPADADRRVRHVFTFLLDINLILQWPMLAYACVYHADLVQVFFGGKFGEYSRLLPLVFIFSTINSIAVPVTLVAQHEEKTAVILLSKVFVVYNLLALALLLPVAGVYGAVFATGSAQALKNLFIWWRVRARAVWLNATALLLTAALLWCTVVGACLAIRLTVHVPPVVHLASGGLICIAGILIYLRSPAISASDRAIFASVFHGKESRILRRLGLLAPAASDRP
jgi:O-antigen/teichoic acid export membrane protein